MQQSRVDAFFSKRSFVDTAIECGLHVITRLRDDAVMHYAPPPKKEGQKGRPKNMETDFRLVTPMLNNYPASLKVSISAFMEASFLLSRSSA